MKNKKFNKPIYYLYGTESCLAEDFLGELKDAVLTPGFESMNFQIYYGDTFDVTDALMTLQTMPAFSDKRLVIIKKASSLKVDHKKALLQYLLDPSTTSILVFVSNASKLPKSEDKFLKAIRKNGLVKVFRTPKEAGALQWLVDEAAKDGKTISREAQTSLIELTGGSLTAIKGELKKIILFVGDKKKIDASDVAEAGLDVKPETIFKLTDAIGQKDLKKAFAIYAKLSTEPSLVIIGSIARHMRILIKIKTAMRDNIPGSKLAYTAGVSAYFLGGYQKSARFYSIAELKRAIKFLFETGMSLKGSGLPEDVVMTNMIMDLCSPLKGISRRR
ncbi:MAG: DNA polymerase III subunit delta [Thermodesulfobacteriota bacterium]